MYWRTKNFFERDVDNDIPHWEGLEHIKNSLFRSRRSRDGTLNSRRVLTSNPSKSGYHCSHPTPVVVLSFFCPPSHMMQHKFFSKFWKLSTLLVVRTKCWKWEKYKLRYSFKGSLPDATLIHCVDQCFNLTNLIERLCEFQNRFFRFDSLKAWPTSQ